MSDQQTHKPLFSPRAERFTQRLCQEACDGDHDEVLNDALLALVTAACHITGNEDPAVFFRLQRKMAAVIADELGGEMERR